MIHVAVAGAAGRMGGRIIQMIQKNEGFELSGAFERPDHPLIGKDAGSIAGAGELGIDIKDHIEAAVDGADVLVDFTTPESTLHNIRVISQTGQAMVIGTTGITGQKKEELQSLARSIRCVMSPNMSVGVNVLFKIVGDLGKILKDGYDMEILETHHKLKKDAPSGTALQLAAVLAGSTGRNLDTDAVYARKGFIGERRDTEIGIQALRAGDIVGEHTVLFAGVGERIEVTHRAHSRDNFAKGALLAAAWVISQPNGLHDMQDVLGLRGSGNVQAS
ncbi:MAG: 4-hydroxy-tetrahydrodipicolinate reductase [Thermodesulfobacteriota bacterium]